MTVTSLIQRSKPFLRPEFQYTFHATIDENQLRKLRAKRIGSIVQEDTYLARKGSDLLHLKEVIRIRKEGEHLTFTYKTYYNGEKYQQVISKSISPADLQGVAAEFDKVIHVNKKRTTYVLGSVLINIDHVESLGDFVEFEVQRKSAVPEVNKLLTALNIDVLSKRQYSYFQLALMNVSPMHQIANKIHEKFGALTFGISSATLTTLGVIISLNTATDSRAAVIGGIAAIAIADSLSDSLSMYASRKSERGSSHALAAKLAFGTFIGKFLFSLTFLIPFLFFPPSVSLYVSIAWGVVLLTFINIQIAYVQEEKVVLSVLKNLGIAIVVMFFSYLVGRIISVLV